MAHVWKAGDLAKCINDDIGSPPVAKPVKFGGIYRVNGVIKEFEGLGLILKGENAAPYRSWNAECFRPILPAEPAFTEAMRSLKPTVEA